MTETPLSVFREYEPWELGKDDYPEAWHKLVDDSAVVTDLLNAADILIPSGVKDVVRAFAGHRCIRCGHPYRSGRFTLEEGDDLHARRSERELGVPQGALDLAFAGLVEDGLAGDIDPAETNRTLWSPCDHLCRHGHADEKGKQTVRRRRHAGESWTRLSTQWAGTVSDAVRLGDEVEAAWRILTVHHLNGRKHDLRWWNLQSLCQRCHLVIQRQVILERVYPFEHDEWFKPYAAGWYAYAYLGENLTREQVMGRLDELLALERMA